MTNPCRQREPPRRLTPSALTAAHTENPSTKGQGGILALRGVLDDVPRATGALDLGHAVGPQSHPRHTLQDAHTTLVVHDLTTADNIRGGQLHALRKPEQHVIVRCPTLLHFAGPGIGIGHVPALKPGDDALNELGNMARLPVIRVRVRQGQHDHIRAAPEHFESFAGGIDEAQDGALHPPDAPTPGQVTEHALERRAPDLDSVRRVSCFSYDKPRGRGRFARARYARIGQIRTRPGGMTARQSLSE